jgi:hypothetical protein
MTSKATKEISLRLLTAARYDVKLGSSRRRRYTILFKRIAIRHYEMTKSINKTSKNLGISPDFVNQKKPDFDSDSDS